VLSDDVRLLQRADWRKLVIAFALALTVVVVMLGVRLMAG
jgi:hypothetical protein